MIEMEFKVYKLLNKIIVYIIVDYTSYYKFTIKQETI